MKHKLPLWSILLAVMFLFISTYAGYLILRSNDACESLETLQGNASNLAGIKLEMQTALSDRDDYLSSTFVLGDTITASHSFHGVQEQKKYYYRPGVPVAPSICFSHEQTSSNKRGHVLYKEISQTLPFTYNSSDSGNNLPFPYIQIDTPDDLYVNIDEYGHIINEDLPLCVGTTAFVTLNGSRYFSVTGVGFLNGIDYQVEGGIFKECDKKIESVYDYQTSFSSKNEIADLIALEDYGCLGLVEKNEDQYNLRIVDPNTKEEKAHFSLGNLPLPDSALLTPTVRVRYNSGSKTLIVSTTAYTPRTSSSLATKAYEDYFNTVDCFNNYEDVKKEFDENVISEYRFTCYSLSDLNTLTECASYDVEDILNKLHVSPDLFLSADDYLYKDGILYLISIKQTNENRLPYLVAVKGNDILYEGYLNTNVIDDYRTNRMGIGEYNTRKTHVDTEPLYKYHQRLMGAFKLSSTN